MTLYIVESTLQALIGTVTRKPFYIEGPAGSMCVKNLLSFLFLSGISGCVLGDNTEGGEKQQL